MGILYSRPTDNIAATAAIAAATGSTEDAEFPVENLVNLNPAKPAKIEETSGGWVFDFGAAEAVELFAIIHHNIAAGLEVRLQANSSDDWGDPPFNELVTIPAYALDGFPANPWLDCSAGSPSNSYQFWRLIVVGVNADPVAIGEVVFSTAKRAWPTHLAPGFGDFEEHPVIEHRTDHGVSTVYDLGTRWRVWRGEMPVVTDAGAEEVRDLVRSARGRGRGFLWIPEETVNEAWFARLGESRSVVYRHLLNVNKIPLEIEEISRGLPL